MGSGTGNDVDGDEGNIQVISIPHVNLIDMLDIDKV